MEELLAGGDVEVVRLLEVLLLVEGLHLVASVLVLQGMRQSRRVVGSGSRADDQVLKEGWTHVAEGLVLLGLALEDVD